MIPAISSSLPSFSLPSMGGVSPADMLAQSGAGATADMQALQNPQGLLSAQGLQAPQGLPTTLPDAGAINATSGLGNGAGSSDFSNLLSNFVSEVNGKQAAASQAVSALQSGQNVSLHQTVIAMEEANVSFQLMVEVRNKLLDSYQELMRMQV